MPSSLPPLILNGMHGIGDNLHERAIVRELMRHNEVWLKTSWPQIFWDMERELHLLPLKSPIAWMAKNEVRTAALYGRTQPPPGTRTISNGFAGWSRARTASAFSSHSGAIGIRKSPTGTPHTFAIVPRTDP